MCNKNKCKDRSTVLKKEILNSSEKRMKKGEEPGSLKTTAVVRRGRKEKSAPVPKSINKQEEKKKK